MSTSPPPDTQAQVQDDTNAQASTGDSPQSSPDAGEASSPQAQHASPNGAQSTAAAAAAAAGQQQQQQGEEASHMQQQQQQHHQQQQQQHQHQQMMHQQMMHQNMPYGMQGGGDGQGDDMGQQFDQATLMAALASNQMMMSHQQRAEQDAINAQAQQQGGMPGMNGGVEICRAFMAGRCSRGGACRFVHVENGAGHQPPNPHLCRDWLNGTCIRGNNCRFQHQGVSGSKASIHNGTAKGPWQGQGVKTVICHQWASRGRCDYGTACKFAHQRLPGGGGERVWNESALDEKKLLAAMLSGLSPQEALSQALNSLQNSNPQKFGGPVQGGPAAGAQQQGAPAQGGATVAAAASATPAQAGQQQAGAAAGAANATSGASQEDPNSPTQQGQVGGQMDQAQMAGVLNAMNGGQQLVPPTKRADGSLILCRFFARHGFCKYGVACKFHHQPNPHGHGGPPMFPPGPYGPMPGGPPNQSLASLLALGLKASMMSNDHLIANHAALLAAHMNNPGAQGPPGAGPPGRMGSPGPMAGPGQGMPPMDPQLANVLAAYLGQQQQQQQNPNIAALLQQLQGGGPNNGGSISPTQLQGFDGGYLGHPQGQDAAFQAYMQHQQQQQNAFGFSPAAANAFNAIPNLNTTPAGAGGAAAAGGAGGANGSNGNGQPNNLSLPQMISTAFRTTGSGVNGPSGGGASGLSNNLSLMNLKPFSDDATSGDSLGGGHQRSNSNSFGTESGSSFSSPSLLANERAYNDYSGGSQSAGASGSKLEGSFGGASLNGSPNAGSLSALFSSSSLNGPFLH